MLQVILGKSYLISLFVTLYVLFRVPLFFSVSNDQSVLLSRREGRAKLANFAHLTHFPTLTNTTRSNGTWPDMPDEAGGRHPTKQPDLPVRECSSIFERRLNF
jgi:hypothetical protein